MSGPVQKIGMTVSISNEMAQDSQGRTTWMPEVVAADIDHWMRHADDPLYRWQGPVEAPVHVCHRRGHDWDDALYGGPGDDQIEFRCWTCESVIIYRLAAS